MANYLPNGDNCTVLYADVFFKPRGEPGARRRHLGIVDRATITPEVERQDKSWKGSVVKQKTTAKNATLNLTMGEATWFTFQAALMAAQADLTQDAGAVSVTMTNVNPGEMLELGAVGVTGLEITAGGTALVEGEDYRPYDPATDFVVMLKPFASVTAIGTAPAIAAGERKVLSILANDTGLAGEFTFVGENTEGQRITVDGVLAELTSDGEFVIHSDTADFQAFGLTGRVIRNPNMPQHPYGRVIPTSAIV